MFHTGRNFGDVLKEAQDKGYAEADPSFDIDGVDSAHKLAILSALAFGGIPDVTGVDIKGIRAISALDIRSAQELGYRIRLLGIARKTARGIEQSVEPCLVPVQSPLATVEGALNAVYVDGDTVGKTLFTGAGAGGHPTASAVVADIADMARGTSLPLTGIVGEKVANLQVAPIGERQGSYFLRLIVLDQPGVIAEVSAILRDENVSLESVLQHGHSPGAPVAVVLTSHETSESAMRSAVDKISALETVVEPPHLMRIEEEVT